MAKNITLKNSLGVPLYPKAQMCGVDFDNEIAHLYGNVTRTEQQDCFVLHTNDTGTSFNLEGHAIWHSSSSNHAFLIFVKKGQTWSCGDGNGEHFVYGVKY